MSDRPPYRPHGSGIYRREMSVHRMHDGALGELVDDFHHFRARVVCEDDRVVDVVAESVRPPWSTCAEAEVEIKRLGGMPLSPSLRAAGRYTPIRTQCTHMFDAAALAIARLGRGLGDVVYSIAIPDRSEECTTATLQRDGEEILVWELAEREITGPAPFAGRRILGHRFADWAEDALDEDRAEAAMLLQRACLISEGRRLDLESYSRAEDVPGGPVGACHTYTSGNLERAERVVGSLRDLTNVQGRLADRS